MKRSLLTAGAVALVSSSLAIAINYATDEKVNPWIWIVVGLLTIISFLISSFSLSDRSGGESGYLTQSQRSTSRSTNLQAGGDIRFNEYGSSARSDESDRQTGESNS